MKSADLGQIVSIVSSVGPLVTTNLKKDEITALVSHALTYLSYDVEQYYVPEEGLWYYDDNTETWNGTITSTIKISDLQEQRKKFASFVFEELFTGGTSSKRNNLRIKLNIEQNADSQLSVVCFYGEPPYPIREDSLFNYKTYYTRA